MNPGSRSLVALSTVGALSLLSAPALAAWPHDPNNGNVPVSVAVNNQLYPTIVPDGAGGAIITWEDIRGGLNFDIYAQRVSAAGVPLWTANGVVICSATSDQQYPTLAADGAGGAIITWYDNRSGNNDIYAQRVNAAGVPQWTANGVALCIAANSQAYPVLVSDGAGGAIVAWEDLRSGVSYDIYAQRVNAAGAPQWAANGVALCTAADLQYDLRIAGDGAGGAIAVWDDFRNLSNYDIYAQRVNAAGAAQWTANGVALCTAASSQAYPTIVSDDAGGAITAWHDFRNGNADIYAQRVNSVGTSLWAPNGVSVCGNASDQAYPSVASDGAGGGIIAWEDFRSASWDIYAQRVSAGGGPQWTVNGVPLCTAVSDQHGAAAISDGAGGAIVTWYDLRNSSYDVFAQRVSGAGAAQWTFNGAAISTAAVTQYNPTVTSDGSGGAIMTWYDNRNGTYDIYAQRIETFGQLGNPEPTIASVRDIPNDQGGKMKLSWDSSYLDAAPDYAINSYWIWRSVPPNVAQAALARGAHLLREDEAPLDGARAQYTTTVEGASTIYWEYVGSQIANGYPGYSYVVPTVSDSVGGSNPRTLVHVQARPPYGPAFWDSPPDSGYSVDNLPPAPPSPFSAAYAGGATHLHWGANHEADFAGYRLYRGSSSSFVPGPGNLVSAQPDTGFGDVGPAGSWYKLSAVDSHGNESVFAVVGPGGTVDAPGGPAVAALSFARPAPDPVAGAETTLRFDLPRDERASLVVVDATGRLVRTLASGTQLAGEHTIEWDLRSDAGQVVPAGLYFLRLNAEGRTLTQRMVALR